MARITKANVVKSKAKAKSPGKLSAKTSAEQLKSEVVKSAAAKRAQIRIVPNQKASSAKTKEATEASSGEKKVSQRLIETIEKRRQAKAGGIPRVPGRRGRRPKALAEYVPNNNEEDSYNNESDYEGLEYDTGIRLKEGKDEAGFSMDRFDDFDEELNFDW